MLSPLLLSPWRALATRAIAGSPSSVSPLPLSLGMFLARAIVDPHIILLSLLSPWLVLAFVPFLALILSPSLLPPWTLLARATCSCKNWVLGPKATPPFIHVQSANFTNNIHIKLRTLNLRGDFWKSGLSCSSHWEFGMVTLAFSYSTRICMDLRPMT